MRRFLQRTFFLVLLLAVSARPVPAEPRPDPAIVRALIVSVDGLRPDLIQKARAPEMQRLIREGTYSLDARTTDVAVTLPSHVSMLTGVPPEKHGVTWNNDREPPVYPAWPSLFELAHGAGYTTAMIAGKSKFTALERPGSLDWAYVPGDKVIQDEAVADTAVAWIARFAPQVTFVHLPSVDTVGHSKGWASEAQLEAIGGADRCIGRILTALRDRGVLDSTVVLISADHGGSGKSHGADVPKSHEIPWLVSGPGIQRGHDLAQTDKVRTEDTFATVCWLLGITPSKPVDGRPVKAILSAQAHAPTGN